MPNDDVIKTSLVIYGCGLIILALIYFIPSFVAFRRQHPNRWPIFAINLIFGGTGIGWLGSLIWAMNATHLSKTGSKGGESGLNLFINDSLKVEPPKSGRAATLDSSEQLLRLKRLYDAGVLSEAEYRSMRKPYLDDLNR